MLIVLSGCSGGGKSTLVESLATRGIFTVPEVGRLIVKEQLASDGCGLPWVNEAEFARLCIRRCIELYKSSFNLKGPVLLDRSLIDAISAIEHLEKGLSDDLKKHIVEFRYHEVVYFTPPWAAIYVTDSERRHSFSDATEEYERLKVSYKKYGYKIVELPLLSAASRAEHLLSLILSDFDAYSDV